MLVEVIVVVDKGLCVAEPLVKLNDVESSVEVDMPEPGRVDRSVLVSELNNVLDVVVCAESDVVDTSVLADSVPEVSELELVDPSVSMLVEVSGDAVEVVMVSEPDAIYWPVVVETGAVVELDVLEFVEVDCSVLIPRVADVLVAAVGVALEVSGLPVLVELKDMDPEVVVTEFELVDWDSSVLISGVNDVLGTGVDVMLVVTDS